MSTSQQVEPSSVARVRFQKILETETVPACSFDFNKSDEVSTSQATESGSVQEEAWDIFDFASSSSLHGINRIFSKANSITRRFAWTMAFFVSLMLFLLQVKK